MQYVLAVDIGTGGIYVGLADKKANLINSEYAEITYRVDKETNSLTWDIEKSWKDLKNLIKKITKKNPNKKIVAITVTSQRHGCVFLDKNSNPILACPNLDGRAKNESENIRKKYAENIYEITARYPDVYFPAIRLLWMKNNQKQIYNDVTQLAMVNEYIIYKMTGKMVAEWTNAVETLLLDINNLKWSDEIEKIIGIDKLEKKQIVKPGTIVDKLKEKIAKELKLPEIPVIAALSDTQSAVLGTGVIDQGEIVVVNGSTTPVLMVENKFIKDKKKRIWIDPYIPGKWMLESNCLQTGLVHRNLINQAVEFINLAVGKKIINKKNIYKNLNKIENNAEEAIACFGSRRFNVASDKIIKPQIELNNEQANIFNAILPAYIENLIFAIAANVRQLEEISQTKTKNIYLTGGGCKNKYFQKLIPDLFKDKNIWLTKDLETTARGAVILAWVAVGEYSCLEDAIKNIRQKNWYEKLEYKENNRIEKNYKEWCDKFN